MFRLNTFSKEASLLGLGKWMRPCLCRDLMRGFPTLVEVDGAIGGAVVWWDPSVRLPTDE